MAKILEQIESKKSVIGGILTKEQLNESFKQNCIPEEFVNYDIGTYYCPSDKELFCGFLSCY